MSVLPKFDCPECGLGLIPAIGRGRIDLQGNHIVHRDGCRCGWCGPVWFDDQQATCECGFALGARSGRGQGMSVCPSCGAPIYMGSSYPFIAQYTCMCRFNSWNVGQINFAPPGTDDRSQGCKPLENLTEGDVRRIVREELSQVGESALLNDLRVLAEAMQCNSSAMAQYFGRQLESLLVAHEADGEGRE